MTILNITTGCMCIITISVIFVFTKWMHEILEDADKPTEIKIKLIDGGKMPEIKTEGATCLDAYARLEEDIELLSGQRATVPLGFAMELPRLYELQVRPRSGLSKKGIDVMFGTGDWDFVGEYTATVVNNSLVPFTVHNGDRICQCGVREVPEIELVKVDKLKETERGSNGWGSTGLR